MAADVGFDRDYTSVAFTVSDARFASVPTTTWLELKDHKRVKPVAHIDGPAYRLTGSGWVDGLDGGGLLQGPRVLERVEAVIRALKAHVAGRVYHHDPLIELATLAVNSGQTAEWCFNVVHSGLLRRWFPNRRMNAYWDETVGGIRVPATFGREPIFDRGNPSTSAG
jgi:hypothetical protein